MQLHYLLFTLFITQCLAETKWVWERNYNSDPYATRRDDYKTTRDITTPYRYSRDYLQYERNRENIRNREIERLRDLERQRDRERDRHRDREPITVRPSGQDDFDDYDIDDPKYNYDQFRPGLNTRPYPLPSRPIPSNQNLRPNPQNGILVGPDGPSGVIGRPHLNNIGNGGSNRLPLTNGLPNNPNDLRPNPANGVLVGPGGPTGIVGRPQYGNGGIGNGYPSGPTGIGGLNSFGGPQGFPQQGISPNVDNRPIQIGPGIGNGGGLYPNPTGSSGYPGNGIYGYPSGPSGGGGGGAGIGSGVGNGFGIFGQGNIYPGQYPVNGQEQQGQYGFYPSQYYPIGQANYGGQGNNVVNGIGNRPYPYPYNNELGGNNNGVNGYYAPGYDEFGRSASSSSSTKDKNKDSLKIENRKVKKSIDDKLATEF